MIRKYFTRHYFLCIYHFRIGSFDGQWITFWLQRDTTWCDVIELLAPNHSKFIHQQQWFIPSIKSGRFAAHLSSSSSYYFLSVLNDLLSNNCTHCADVFRFVCLSCQVKNQYSHTFERWQLLNTSPSLYQKCKYKLYLFCFLWQLINPSTVCLYIYMSVLDIS